MTYWDSVRKKKQQVQIFFSKSKMEIFSFGSRLSLLLVTQTAFYFFGIYIFTQGFLLNRLVIPQNSSCDDTIGNSSTVFTHGVDDIAPCWRSPRFKKAVLIVVDALRYDFMLYNESLPSEEARSFQNKLVVIHQVLKTKPNHGRVFKFVADPPTTTMQRIKGLTTGSLPTFIDVGSNFASSEIHEDNIISQLKNLGKKIVFMGDDTWMGLFPNSFKRYYPYPSFNVKDLHTVDNGVITHLTPEIQRDDWDVIIAHFLGVDHCGHRYGPYHPAMAEKLTQMDKVLRSVVDIVDNDTILMVFGDHGMTKSGDHGGDSEDEVHAGLFVYSPAKLFSHAQAEDDNVVSQTDIVPTLSLLLGLPIPFSNLGIIITSLFEETGSQNLPKNSSKLHALQLNARQVYRYLKKYAKLSNDISSNALNAKTKLFFKGEGVFSTKVFDSLQREKAYLTYLKEIRELCRLVWAKFDIAGIQTGIFIVAVCCLMSLLSIVAPPFLNEQLLQELQKCGIFVVLIFIPGLFLFYGYVSLFLLVFLTYGIAALLMKWHTFIIGYTKDNVAHIRFKDVLIVFLLCAHFAGYFSNSFVIHEDEITLFFLQTVLLVLAIFTFLNNPTTSAKLSELENPPNSHKTQKRNDKKKRNFAWTILEKMKGELAYLFILMVISRLGALFWPCREEQTVCEPTEFAKIFSSTSGQNGYQFGLSSILLLLVPASLVFRLRAHGNLNGYSCSVLAVKYALPFGALFACVHWLLLYVPAKMVDENPAIGFIQQILTPCITYCCCLVTLCCLLYEPITVSVIRPRDLHNEAAISADEQSMKNAVVEIFKLLRSEMSEMDKNDNVPRVYGLGTVYSSALASLLACLALPAALVLGDGLGSSVTLMLAQMYLFLEFDRLMTSQEVVEAQSSLGSLLFPVTTWMMMSSHGFFSSGHQATIPSIRFEAAFVGLPGDMESFYLPGVLILLNTLASDVLFTLALPLILFWRKQTPSNKAAENKSADCSRTAEFVYHENPTMLRSDMFRVCALYQVSKGFKLLGTMSAAAVHRRHLMVWKIFAPKFIFEGVSFIVTSVILILVFEFVLRVDQALNVWSRTIQRRADTL